MEKSDVIILIISGIAFLFLMLGFIVYFIVFYRNKQIEHKAEQEEMETRFNSALLESQLEIQEEVLRHVSREIHDNLGQIGALIKLNLISIPPQDDESVNHKLEETRALMKKLMSDLKSLSVSLNVDYLEEQGLFRALEMEAERLNHTGLIRAEFSSSGSLTLSHSRQILVFRMCQELISNVIKHAGANSVFIFANTSEAGLTVEIVDDGDGFDLEAAKLKQESTGIKSLIKRGRLLNAEFSIDSTPGKGTKAIIQLDSQVNG